jgi:hypothetical protein
MNNLLSELKQYAQQYGYHIVEEDEACFVLKNPHTGDAFCETKDRRGIQSVISHIEFQQECQAFRRNLGIVD